MSLSKTTYLFETVIVLVIALYMYAMDNFDRIPTATATKVSVYLSFRRSSRYPRCTS